MSTSTARGTATMKQKTGLAVGQGTITAAGQAAAAAAAVAAQAAAAALETAGAILSGQLPVAFAEERGDCLLPVRNALGIAAGASLTDIIQRIHTNMRGEMEKVNNSPAAAPVVIGIAAEEEGGAAGGATGARQAAAGQGSGGAGRAAAAPLVVDMAAVGAGGAAVGAGGEGRAAAAPVVVDIAAEELEAEELEAEEAHVAALQAVFGLCTCADDDDGASFPLQGATPCVNPSDPDDFLIFQLERPPERVLDGLYIVDVVTGERHGAGTWYYPARQFRKVPVDVWRPDLGLRSDSWVLDGEETRECNVVASHVKIVGREGESPILSGGVNTRTGQRKFTLSPMDADNLMGVCGTFGEYEEDV